MLDITIDYTDDFNQAQVITRTISIVVEEMMVGPEGGIPPDGGFPQNGGEFPGGEIPGGEFPTDGGAQTETFGQKVVRFLKGLFGLDSAQPSGGGEIMPPVEGIPEEGPSEAVPVAPPIKG